jgi:MFS family permease
MHRARRWKVSAIDSVGIVGLFSSLAMAAVATIWAVYLDSFVNNAAYVGFLTSFFTIIGITSYIFLIPLVEKNDKAKLYSLAVLIYIVSYLMFALLPYFYVIIILGTITAIAGSLKVTVFGIIVRDKTKDDCLSKNEGFIYTLLNLSWLVSPVIAGFISSRYGIRSVFIFGAIMLTLALLSFRLFKVHDGRITKKVDKNPLKPLITFFKSKERNIAYFISGGVNFWWSLIYIYMPIYIFESGFDAKIIGYFLGAIVIPLVLTEYLFAKLAGKKGFKKIFVIGYCILSAAALSVFFISNMHLILLILVLASFGAGMLEPTTEAYFFDVISKKQRDKFYGPYNTAIDLNSFLSTSMAAVILLFLPFKFIFIMFSAVMFFFAVMSSWIRNVIESKKK